MPSVRDNIHICLARPKHAGNIGSAARAMKNMGFSRLVLVDPAPYDTPETYMLGWNSEEVIRGAAVFPDLKQALRDCHLVVGTSRRKGRGRDNFISLEDAAEEIASVARRHRVAVVFGSESAGLLNSELRECHKVCTIDTYPKFPSLNLAQAVMVVCYELHKRLRRARAGTSLKPAPKDMLDLMYSHADAALALLGYDAQGSRPLRKQILKRLHAVFSRALLEKRDVQMVRGLCAQIEKMTGGRT